MARRFALPVLGALILTCVLASTASATSKVTIDAHITPVIRQFTTKTTPSTLSINLIFRNVDGGPADVLTKAVLNFSYGAQLHGEFFPSCKLEAIQKDGPKACPRGSKIGTGSAVGNLADIQEPLEVSLYNALKGKGIIFFLHGERPAIIDVPFLAPLQTFKSGTYNYGLTVNVPEVLQRIVGVDVSIDFFKVKVGATKKVKGRKRGYIETLICPPGALVPLKGTFSFIDNPDAVEDQYIHCG